MGHCQKSSRYLLEKRKECKSDGESRQHHYTTKSITIPYLPEGKSRDRVGAGGESRMPEGREIPPQGVS